VRRTGTRPSDSPDEAGFLGTEKQQTQRGGQGPNSDMGFGYSRATVRNDQAGWRENTQQSVEFSLGTSFGCGTS